MGTEKTSKESVAERGFRQLSFERSVKINADLANAVEDVINTEKRLSKQEIYDLYKQEIDDLIKEDRKKLTADYDLKFKKELSIKEKEISDAYKEKNAILDEKINKFDSYMELINKDFNDFCNKEIIQFDTLIISVVMEVLYKITGNSTVYQELVSASVKDALVKKISDYKTLIIKVSKDDFIFFKKNYGKNDWINTIHVDDGLSVGHIVLDDGFSLFECGLIDQLDHLRSEFILALRSNYE